MPDCSEKFCNISCCSAESVGTGLEEGVGAGMTKALRISSLVALRINSWSLTMHSLSTREELGLLLRRVQVAALLSKSRMGGQNSIPVVAIHFQLKPTNDTCWQTWVKVAMFVCSSREGQESSSNLKDLQNS